MAATFARARWGFRFASRERLLRWQQRRIARLLSGAASRAAFYRPYAGAGLPDLPIVDKALVLEHFADFNTRGVSLDRAMGIAIAAERSRDFLPTLDGLTVGLSSGTSGTRGIFLVSPQERQRWAGLMLARLLTTAALRQFAQPWRPPLRIAFALRANSNLYESVGSRRLRFTFLDLIEPFDAHLRRLNASPPHILVAPPTVLRRLAVAVLSGDLRIAPTQVVSVAEVIEPDDRVAIDRAFGVPIQEVYQATEGFLGASCAAGRIHLNEQFLHVEPEWIGSDRRRFRPIVTDFTRTTQLVVRYRLDDMLRAAAGPCPCGQVTRSLEAIEGRADDVLWLRPKAGGAARAVFPDLVRRSMALAGPIGDYRIEQREATWHVQIDLDPAGALAVQPAIQRELAVLGDGLGLEPAAVRFDPWHARSPIDKRRRIRCLTPPAIAEKT